MLKELVTHFYLPSIRDAAPNTRKGTASHLDDGAGIPVRAGHYAEPAALSQLPIGAIGSPLQDDPEAGGEPRCGRFWLGDTGGRDVVVIVNRFGSVLDRPGPRTFLRGVAVRLSTCGSKQVL